MGSPAPRRLHAPPTGCSMETGSQTRAYTWPDGTVDGGLRSIPRPSPTWATTRRTPSPAMARRHAQSRARGGPPAEKTNSRSRRATRRCELNLGRRDRPFAAQASSPTRLLIARDAKASKHSQGCPSSSSALAYATKATGRLRPPRRSLRPRRFVAGDCKANTRSSESSPTCAPVHDQLRADGRRTIPGRAPSLISASVALWRVAPIRGWDRRSRRRSADVGRVAGFRRTFLCEGFVRNAVLQPKSVGALRSSCGACSTRALSFDRPLHPGNVGSETRQPSGTGRPLPLQLTRPSHAGICRGGGAWSQPGSAPASLSSSSATITMM